MVALMSPLKKSRIKTTDPAGLVVLEVLQNFGLTYREMSESIDITIPSISDKVSGRRKMGRYSMLMTCCLVEALRDLKDDAAREELVMRGLKLMREIEEEHGEE